MQGPQRVLEKALDLSSHYQKVLQSLDRGEAKAESIEHGSEKGGEPPHPAKMFSWPHVLNNYGA